MLLTNASKLLEPIPILSSLVIFEFVRDLSLFGINLLNSSNPMHHATISIRIILTYLIESSFSNNDPQSRPQIKILPVQGHEIMFIIHDLYVFPIDQN